MTRDRDSLGRARQQRPRDALGRPLPYGSVGVPPVPEEALPPRETIDLARTLVAQGRAFGAHEVLEARWKACPHAERPYWQGLAQICVALTHEARGNHEGARRLWERGSVTVRTYADGGGPTYGLDVDGMLRCAHDQLAGARRS